MSAILEACEGLVLVVVSAALAVAGWACGGSDARSAPVDGKGVDAGTNETGMLPEVDAAVTPDATTDATVPPVDTLPANRDRLLGTYLAYLKATPGKQSNGLDGSKLTGVCDLWRTLVPSAQSVYLTLTARLQGSKVAVDSSSMLSTRRSSIAWPGATARPAPIPASAAAMATASSCRSTSRFITRSSSRTPPREWSTAAPRPRRRPHRRGSFWRDSHDSPGRTPRSISATRPRTPPHVDKCSSSRAPRARLQ